MNDIRNEIKSIITLSGWSLTDIVKKQNEINNENNSPQNLSNKLYRGTIKYAEVKEIAEIIGYELVWQKKE